MEEKGGILITLDRLDIGGVETFVCNQSQAIKSKGYDVYILSKKGIYSEYLEKKGIKCIEFEFKDEIYYDFEKIKKVIEIFEKYNIKEVHINQFPAMNVILPACLMKNIPYIVYLHMGAGLIENEKLNAYNYFERNFCTYKENFKILFKYAYKIIAITPEIKDYTIKRYDIEDKEKCIVIPNSINFDEYKTNTKVTQIKNILIVSRISTEKLKGIINAIELYKSIKEKSKEEVKLTIAGSGNELENVKKYVEDNNIENVTFLGGISNVKEVIEQNDLLIGIGRCILEALAMKKIAVISGYDSLKGVLRGQNTEKAIEENLTGRTLEDTGIEETANEILSLEKNDFEEIVENNYKQVFEKRNINSNIYIANIEQYKYNIEILDFLKTMIEINYKIGKREEQAREKIESNWKEHIEYKEWIENQIELLKEQNQNNNVECNQKNSIDEKPFFSKVKRKIKNIFRN